MKVKTLKPRNPFVKIALFKKASRHENKAQKVKGGYSVNTRHRLGENQ